METKKNRSTKIVWEKDMDDLEGKYRSSTERYPYLKEEKYCHKREQLYLMLQYGMSDTFIDSFFKWDENISSRDLDFVRMTAMLFGENFTTEHFYKKEHTLEQAKELLAGHVVQMRLAGLPKLEELLQEQKWMKERFELQCEFLEKERERSKQHFEELLAKERELCEERASSERLKMELEYGSLEEKFRNSEKEKVELKEKLDDATKQRQNEADQWEAEKNRLLDKCTELKERLEQDGVHTDAPKESYFSQLRSRKEQQRRRREKEEKNRLILTVISDSDYSKEQLEFIIQAVQSELSLPELRQLCNPKLPIKSMELLEQFYLEQRGGIG
ncbi:hypothetical protein [Ruminococcus sp. 5_1_39BFAA]|uniref:hypothetical protein n=1 Tax=Ruminococcus sp. 5_1_39BFAA TaxID=457412 RepID=UPI003564EA4C